MKALLISPDTQSLDEVEISGLDDVQRLIGYATLESDTVGADGDRLFFDEECFIRGSEGRFQIDKLIPVAGKGVLVGTEPDGTTLRDARTTPGELRGRIKFQ